MNRTPDLLITNELLYRLSYSGVFLISRKEPPAGSPGRRKPLSRKQDYKRNGAPDPHSGQTVLLDHARPAQFGDLVGGIAQFLQHGVSMLAKAWRHRMNAARGR